MKKENKVDRIIHLILLIIVVISVISLTAIGKYYEVKEHKKAIENLELEREILIKKKELIDNNNEQNNKVPSVGQQE